MTIADLSETGAGERSGAPIELGAQHALLEGLSYGSSNDITAETAAGPLRVRKVRGLMHERQHIDNLIAALSWYGEKPPSFQAAWYPRTVPLEGAEALLLQLEGVGVLGGSETQREARDAVRSTLVALRGLGGTLNRLAASGPEGYGLVVNAHLGEASTIERPYYVGVATEELPAKAGLPEGYVLHHALAQLKAVSFDKDGQLISTLVGKNGVVGIKKGPLDIYR